VHRVAIREDERMAIHNFLFWELRHSAYGVSCRVVGERRRQEMERLHRMLWRKKEGTEVMWKLEVWIGRVIYFETKRRAGGTSMTTMTILMRGRTRLMPMFWKTFGRGTCPFSRTCYRKRNCSRMSRNIGCGAKAMGKHMVLVSDFRFRLHPHSVFCSGSW
jgi:hypothetical protein